MKSLIVHAVVAVVALGAAYGAYIHGRGAAEGGGEDEAATLVVVDLARSDLTAVRYESETRSVRIETGEPPLWVSVTTRTKVPPPRPSKATTESDASPAGDAGVAADGGNGSGQGDAGATDGGATAPEEPEQREDTVQFVANDVLDELLEGLAPLKAVRRLGKVPEARLEEFELDEPEGTLTLELREGARVLKVGGRTYGGGDHYVLDETSAEVYLLPANVVRDVQMAQTRLIQRDLHRFEDADVESAVITAGDRRRALEHRNRQSEDDARWVDPDAPESGLEQYGNWMGQLGRLRALSYFGPDDQPSEGLIPIFRVDFRGGGEELGHLELGRIGEGASAEYVGRSEATGVWVRLARTAAEQVAEDIGEVVGSTDE